MVDSDRLRSKKVLNCEGDALGYYKIINEVGEISCVICTERNKLEGMD